MKAFHFKSDDDEKKQPEGHGGLLLDTEDITVGVSEVDLRVTLNFMARATACYVLANSIQAMYIAENPSRKDETSTPALACYSSFIRRALYYLDKVSSTEAGRKMMPINRM